jgi:hypothetical protein
MHFFKESFQVNDILTSKKKTKKNGFCIDETSRNDKPGSQCAS